MEFAIIDNLLPIKSKAHRSIVADSMWALLFSQRLRGTDLHPGGAAISRRRSATRLYAKQHGTERMVTVQTTTTKNRGHVGGLAIQCEQRINGRRLATLRHLAIPLGMPLCEPDKLLSQNCPVGR